MTPDRPALDLDLLAASLRADSSDVTAFVEGLASWLEQALPGRVGVYRWRERTFGRKAVRKVRVEIDNRRFELVHKRGVIETSCGMVSGGIVLKTEPLDPDQWLAALGEALAAEAQRSETTRQALERLLT